jgi:hypothetical protein
MTTSALNAAIRFMLPSLVVMVPTALAEIANVDSTTFAPGQTAPAGDTLSESLSDSPENFETFYQWLSNLLDELDTIVTAAERATEARSLTRAERISRRLRSEARRAATRYRDSAQTFNNRPSGRLSDGGTEDLGLHLEGGGQAGHPDLHPFSDDGATSAGRTSFLGFSSQSGANSAGGFGSGYSDSGGSLKGGFSDSNSPSRGLLVKPLEDVYFLDWPWSGKQGRNLFFWILGPPFITLVGLVIGLVVVVQKPAQFR